jgi:hypothetical protein
MAAELFFSYSNTPAMVRYNLLTGTLKLVDRSWRTDTPAKRITYRHSRFGAQMQFSYLSPVTESMQLVGADTVSNLLTAINTIEDILEEARLSNDNPHQSDKRWLQFHADGESDKRSLLYHGRLIYPTEVGFSSLMQEQKIIANLHFTRHPLWEDVSATSATETNVSTVGGTWYSSSGAGTAPGRIAKFAVKGRSGGGGPISQVWVGIREKLDGNTAFEAVWEAEDGTNNGATDSADHADATASGGNCVQCGFTTTASMVKRFEVKGDDVGASLGMAGRYLVLMRCRVETSTTVAAQLKTGLAGGNALDPHEKIYIDNDTFSTDWRFVEMGEIDIPPINKELYGRPSGTFEEETMIELWVERVSGSNGFEVDCFVLIPSRHMFFIDGADVQYDGGPPAFYSPATVYTFPNDTVDAVAYDYSSEEPDNTIEFSTRDFYLPKDGWLVVVAAQRATVSTLGDDVDLEMDYHPRWYSFRDT